MTAPFNRRSAPVIAREQHGAYVVLQCLDDAGPTPAAGQFYMLATGERWGGGEGERPFLPRAFSVLRVTRTRDGTAVLHFMLEAVGPGTRRLCELATDDELLIVGPLGRGFTAPPDGRAPLLVGGGVGIAPLAIWQDQLWQVQLGSGASVLLGFRDAKHAGGAALLSDAEVATDDGSVGHHGLVTELLAGALDTDLHRQVYACGPPPMLQAVHAVCAERDVPAQLALESGMACGYGACFGCVVPTRRGLIRLCLEGPVLEAAELENAAFAGSGH